MWYVWIPADTCDLFPLLNISASSPDMRQVTGPKTNPSNEQHNGGGDWGKIINDEPAAGQRCSLKTSLPSPKETNGASIKWHTDVLEFLSWALVGKWDVGLHAFEKQCGFQHQTRPLGPLICWVVCVSLEMPVDFLKAPFVGRDSFSCSAQLCCSDNRQHTNHVTQPGGFKHGRSESG